MKSLLFLALLVPCGATVTTVWNPAANGISPPATGSWGQAANWTGAVVPDGDFKAVFNVPNAAECVLTGEVTVKHLVTGDQGPGGVLRLAAGARLTCTDWGGPYNRSSLIIVEDGAVADFQSRLLIGQFDDPGEHDMEFRMNGGSVNVNGPVRIGESFDATNVVPHIQLNGGTLTADRLEIDRGTVDLTQGTILLRTDQSADVGRWLADGNLTAFGGSGEMEYDWNVRNPDRLTVTANALVVPPAEFPLALAPTPGAPGSEGYFTTGSSDGRPVWIAGNMLYFNLQSDLFPTGSPVFVRVKYHDIGRGRLTLKYDSDEGEAIGDKYRPSEIHTRSDRVDRGGFAVSYHQLANPRFANRQNGGNDFRIELAQNNGTPFEIASVEIGPEPFDDPAFQFSLSRPWLGPYLGESRDFVDAGTTAGKVMTGYQGWFGTPNDPEDGGWKHWARGSFKDPSPTEITVDMWPFLQEYEPENLYPAGDMNLADGRPAHVFSSRDPETVRRHFRWMRQHDIDGAYLQRFVTRSNSGAFGAPEFVLHNVRRAANLEGRVWAIEYDISSMANDPDPFEVITKDWTWLVEEARILEDPRYLQQDGKPVVFIWGISVPGREGISISEGNAILDWFNTQNLYLIGGVHSSWLETPAWHGHYRKYDQLLAWMERTSADLAAQKAQLDAWGMKILPHAWPGFSWHNLQKLTFPNQYTPRDGGAFYWERLYNAVNLGADQIFLGMFDEYDEGTAIMPMSGNTPLPHTAWGHYINNGGRDPFYYLQLSAAARQMLNGFRPLSPTLPAGNQVPPGALGGEDATVYFKNPDQVEGLAHPQPPDGITVPVAVAGQPCRVLSAGSYFYFALDDAIRFAVAAGAKVTVEVAFYDSDPSVSLRLQYDSLNGAYSNHPTVIATPGAGGWRNARWEIANGFFGNRQNEGADFRIQQLGGTGIPIRRVSVFLPEKMPGANDLPKLAWVNGGLEWSDLADATGWRLFRSYNLKPSSWEEVSALEFVDHEIRHQPASLSGSGFFRLQRSEP